MRRPSPREIFTPEEEAIVAREYDKGTPPLDVWRMYLSHRSQESVRAKMKRIAKGHRNFTTTAVGTLSRAIPASAHGAKDASDEQSDEEFLQEWLTATDRACRFYTDGGVAELSVDHNRPVLVSFSSDWHLSAAGATYARELYQYLEALAATPDAIGLAVGDLLDLSIRHGPTDMKGAPHEVRALRILLSKVKDRIIVLSGNHDERTTQLTGISILAETCRELGIPFFRDEVFLFVTRRNAKGDVTHRNLIAARHAYYRDSTLNHTHKCWRWLEQSQSWPEAPGNDGTLVRPDAIAIGHSHQGATETRMIARRPVHGLALGAWQAGSRYSAFKGFSPSGPTAPTVVLPGRRGEHTKVIADWRDALGAAPVAATKPTRKKAA